MERARTSIIEGILYALKRSFPEPAGPNPQIQAPSPPILDPADEAFEARAELEAANRHAHSNNIGKTQTYDTPFSRQLRIDTAAQFPEDNAFYKEAEIAMRRVLFAYGILRLTGVFVFGLYIVLFNLTAYHYMTGLTAKNIFGGPFATIIEIISAPQLGGALGWAVILSFVSVVARGLLRLGFFMFIDTEAQKLSFKIIKRIDDINTRIADCLTYAQTRTGAMRWSRRARNWLKVALWNAKRAEYLDRYSTTITWLVRFYTVFIENLFWTYMIALSAPTIFLLWTGYAAFGGLSATEPVAASAFSMILILTTAIGWGYLFRRRGDFWTQEFRQEVQAAEASTAHYFDQIGDLAQNLVEMIVANERNPRQPGD